MPILGKEKSLFPDSLLEGPCHSKENQWMVLYTKPRQEKSLARELLRRSVPFYLPLVKKNLQYGRRRVTSFAPLFGGLCLHVQGSKSERVASRSVQTAFFACFRSAMPNYS